MEARFLDFIWNGKMLLSVHSDNLLWCTVIPIAIIKKNYIKRYAKQNYK